MIPLLLNLVAFSYIVDMYDRSMFVSYCIYLSMGVLEMQSMGHFIGIVFSSNQRLAVFISIGVLLFCILFGNFMIQTQTLHYSLQMVSYLSTFKLVLESILILYYGFDRCSDREFSFVLYFFNINDNDLYINTYLLVLQFIILRGLSLAALLYKVNPLSNSKDRQKRLEELTNDSNLNVMPNIF